MSPSRQYSWCPVAALKRRATAAVLLGTVSACATVPLRPWGEDPNQSIEIVAADLAGVARVGLKCVLRNDRGEWQVTVPGRIELTRSAQPLRIECVDDRGITISHPDVAATDERKERAKRSATRFGVVGVVGTVLFLGAFALTPAAIVYMAAGGATVGGMAAAEQATADTVAGSGGGYPSRIELRY